MKISGKMSYTLNRRSRSSLMISLAPITTHHSSFWECSPSTQPLMFLPIIAEPHAEIIPEDFYKHIHDELLEPQRMKQLLSWCGSRALTPAGPNDKDFNARTICKFLKPIDIHGWIRGCPLMVPSSHESPLNALLMGDAYSADNRGRVVGGRTVKRRVVELVQ